MFREISIKGNCIKCNKPIEIKGNLSLENQLCEECKKKFDVNINYT